MLRKLGFALLLTISTQAAFAQQVSIGQPTAVGNSITVPGYKIEGDLTGVSIKTMVPRSNSELDKLELHISYGSDFAIKKPTITTFSVHFSDGDLQDSYDARTGRVTVQRVDGKKIDTGTIQYTLNVVGPLVLKSTTGLPDVPINSSYSATGTITLSGTPAVDPGVTPDSDLPSVGTLASRVKEICPQNSRNFAAAIKKALQNTKAFDQQTTSDALEQVRSDINSAINNVFPNVDTAMERHWRDVITGEILKAKIDPKKISVQELKYFLTDDRSAFRKILDLLENADCAGINALITSNQAADNGGVAHHAGGHVDYSGKIARNTRAFRYGWVPGTCRQ